MPEPVTLKGGVHASFFYADPIPSLITALNQARHSLAFQGVEATAITDPSVKEALRKPVPNIRVAMTTYDYHVFAAAACIQAEIELEAPLPSSIRIRGALVEPSLPSESGFYLVLAEAGGEPIVRVELESQC